MTQKPDGIARLKNCPTKGDEIRRAIAQSRKDFLPAEEAEEAEPGQPPAQPMDDGQDA
ncbi:MULTISPECIES: hypothetical protein [Pseudomonas]|uniref:Uncharacterized protein n=1 Tax=Pseudomonas fluorescens TaxID=294 RepID=A0A944HG14_PSEFL|nr:hypothetical protein [Pseudomonas fluorescens]MBT2298686.1 hypothetical protein [Pseudomonas fluorescens]MBT2310363.1 hypothetical protein [Pseudomonas fluorescens]MBT2312805.1 hypothetical protein [Pseudomonas fluorescens]MBT2320694.1 hypothetical protein [Pseudomonas fluorescens]MBT2332292.1 hypothetical protein [Pseudomonas fluorescens]